MRKPRDTVADVWASYAKTMPADAGVVQRREMCRSFFAGFAGAFSLLVRLSHYANEDEATAHMDRLRSELEAFADLQLQDDWLPPKGSAP